MNLILTTFFVSAIFASTVEACSNIKFGIEDDVTRCNIWWENGYKSVNDLSYRKMCVSLILSHCPNMIEITKKFTRQPDFRAKARKEHWKTETRVSLSADPNNWMRYYDYQEKTLCSDDDGHNQVEDCDYWWSIVKKEDVEDKYKETCIANIFKHCENKIKEVEEFEACAVQMGCRKGYDVVTVVYVYGNREKASINRKKKQYSGQQN